MIRKKQIIKKVDKFEKNKWCNKFTKKIVANLAGWLSPI